MTRWTVRSRIIFTYIALLVGVVALLGVFLHLVVRHALYSELDQHLLSDSKEIESIVNKYSGDNDSIDSDGLRRLLNPFIRTGSQLRLQTSDRTVDVRLPQGLVLDTFPRAPKPVSINLYGASKHFPRHRILTRSFGDEIESKWMLTLATHTHATDKRLWRFFRRYLIGSVLVFGVFLAGGWFLAARALRPTQQMAESVRTLDEERLESRIPVPDAVDEIRYLAETFNGLLDRIDRSVQAQKRLGGDVAHELRTPLARLRAEIETSLRDPRDPELDQERLSHVLSQTTALSRIIDDLLLLARADAKALKIKTEPVDLVSLLESLVETAEILGEERGVTIQCSDLPASITVEGESSLLERLFMNVIENAIRYNRDGGTVRISADRESDQFVIRIFNTGVGIEPDHLPRIFERFFRSNSARTPGEGTGLGLPIASAIAKVHGGSIDVESEPGVETIFHILLPASEAERGDS